MGGDPPAPDFRALFESAPNLYLVLSPDLRIAAVSDAYCRATMTCREAILGRHLFDVFPDNPDDGTADGTRNLLHSLTRVRELRRPDAMPVQKYDIPRPVEEGGGFELRYWSPLNTPVLDGEGKLAWIIHRVEDVTDLVRHRSDGATYDSLHLEQASTITHLREANRALALRNEENAALQRSLITRSQELQRSETRLAGFLAAIPDAVIIVDEQARIRFASDRVESMFGHAPTTLLGQPIGNLLPMRFRAGHERFIRGYMSAPEARDMRTGAELFAERADGREFPVEIRLNPERIGEELFVIAAIRDITDRRTVEMQLRQAQKMEAVGNLTGGLAHDFNNLLGVIIGNLDLLRERASLDSDAAELAHEALEAAMRGADLTQRLLAFARRQPLQPRPIELPDMVTRTARLLSRTLGENIEIRLELDSATWPVVVDPAQLEASLVNIANNARDAMPRGGTLRIATNNRQLDAEYAQQHPDVRPGQYATIEISDSGSGIGPDVLPQIFEPFFTTKPPGKGTGLGLSMVFGFMKQSGGHITVYSEVGVGTTFRLFLPAAAPATEPPTVGPPTQPERRGSERVLVVEDNAGLSRIAVRQLADLGYSVLAAGDAAAALAILGRERVDILFTDIVMPGGTSGYELAQIVRERWPQTRIVLTSGFPDGKLAGGEDAGADIPLLSKPYRKVDLARVLRSVMET